MSTTVPNNDGKQVCTQDAKACPDGSYVSRTGSNCDFAACPEKKTNNEKPAIDSSGWKTYRNEQQGFEFAYRPVDYHVRVNEYGNSKWFQMQVLPNENLNTEAIEIYSEIRDGYCYLDLCGKIGLGKEVYNTVEWDYLGHSTYCDAGECGTTEAIYRAGKGERVYYVKAHSKERAEQLLKKFYFIDALPN